MNWTTTLWLNNNKYVYIMIVCIIVFNYEGNQIIGVKQFSIPKIIESWFQGTRCCGALSIDRNEYDVIVQISVLQDGDCERVCVCACAVEIKPGTLRVS